MTKKSSPPRLYGLMAEFVSPEELVDAARRAREAGYRRFDAYSPYPIEGLPEAAGLSHSRLPSVVLAGGIVGGLGGLALQWWVSAVAYPLNIGGRPYASWPAFIPVTFETTILVAGIVTVLGMFALCGLPMPYHPVFNVPRFALVSRDRYFLCIEARDPKFDLKVTREFLQGIGPSGVYDVEE